MSKPKIVKIINSMDEESFRVVVNGIEVGYADHDSHGWSGMDALRKTMKRTAKAISYTFVQEYEESEE